MRGRWRFMEMVVFTSTMALVSSGLVGMLSPWSVPVAHATVQVARATVVNGEHGNPDKAGGKEKNQDKNEGSDADHKTEGQVIDINTLKNPPELIVTSKDGDMVVRLLKTDEVEVEGVRLGDYVELDGEKINEQLWEVTQVSVEERCCKDPAPAKQKGK